MRQAATELGVSYETAARACRAAGIVRRRGFGSMDPEIRNGDSNQSYIDTNVYGDAFYPRSRTALIGVNVSFK